jgi:hypothetical protein
MITDVGITLELMEMVEPYFNLSLSSMHFKLNEEMHTKDLVVMMSGGHSNMVASKGLQKLTEKLEEKYKITGKTWWFGMHAEIPVAWIQWGPIEGE